MKASPSRKRKAPRLIADVGGTHSRCALVVDGRMGEANVVLNDRHNGIADMLRAGLAALAPEAPVTEAAIAVAAPVRGDNVNMTNRGWQFSVEGLRRELGLERLDVINDFTAIALALPHIDDPQRVAIGGGAPLGGAAVAVLGPGTGLGVSALIPHHGAWAAVTGEGGHVTLPASNELEARLIERARGRFGHVSAERFVSGPGLLNLYEVLALELGVPAIARTPKEVSARAASGDDLARRTLDLFFAFLGTVAADAALTFGALGGLYLAGGILPGHRDALLASNFRTRFESKGRYLDYLRAIPTYLVTAPQPGLIGLQHAFGHGGGETQL
jgi:glucokinase